MLKAGILLARLYERILPEAKNRKVADLRIGLGYTGIKLDNDSAGIAAVLFDVLPHGCSVMSTAGSFAGSSASDLLKYLVDGKNPLEVAIGLAAANALIGKPLADCADDKEATTYLNLKPGEKVAMVGLFAPLVEKIRATGAILTVIEKNPQRLELLSYGHIIRHSKYTSRFPFPAPQSRTNHPPSRSASSTSIRQCAHTSPHSIRAYR